MIAIQKKFTCLRLVNSKYGDNVNMKKCKLFTYTNYT